MSEKRDEYYFSIGAIFKNEAHIMKEWIDHYFFHGVDHIYLINDLSNDNFLTILEPYVKENKVTLYNTEFVDKHLGIQSEQYDHYFLEESKKSTWFGIFDLDEFIYSPDELDLKKVLKKYEHINQIQIDGYNFGSNGHVKQPKLVVPGFTKREDKKDALKSIAKTSALVSFGIHSHKTEKLAKKTINLTEKALVMNHYRIQSWEFFSTIKMTRGDVNEYIQTQGISRDRTYFEQYDTNDISDTRLSEQNKDLFLQ